MDAQNIKENTAGTTRKRKKSSSKAREPTKPPPAPTYPPGPETGLLRDEQQVAGVEMLMTRGVRSKRDLMNLKTAVGRLEVAAFCDFARSGCVSLARDAAAGATIDL